MKKKTKTFNKKNAISDAYKFTVEAIGDVIGDLIKPDDKFPKSLRITVETVAVELDAVDLESVLIPLGMEDVKTHLAVRKFLAYRREDLRKPIRSRRALTRILRRFENQSRLLQLAITESMAQGWTGLFIQGKEHRSAASRSINTEGNSDGGNW